MNCIQSCAYGEDGWHFASRVVRGYYYRRVPKEILWISWILRMTSLIHKCGILIQADCCHDPNSFAKRELGHFKFIWWWAGEWDT